MSYFTECLQLVGKYSEAIDRRKVTHEDFVDFQRLESYIYNVRENYNVCQSEYRALLSITNTLHKKFRVVLGLDR